MTIGRKICGLIIVAVTAALLLCAAFLLAPAAKAENPAPVTLSDDTVFAVSPTHVAYTSGNSLSIVDLSYSSDPFTLSNAFEGSATDIEITSDKIAVLSQGASGKNLKVYSYSEEGIGAEAQSQNLSDALPNAVTLAVYGDDLLLVTTSYIRYITGTDTALHYISRNEQDVVGSRVFYTGALGMYFEGIFDTDNMIILKSEGLYTFDTSEKVAPFLQPINTPETAYGMASKDGALYISCATGVYSYDISSNVFAKLSGMSYPSAIDIEGEYLYAFDKDALAIKRYEIGDTALKYNKCYDAEVYLAPTEFDIVQELRPASGDELTLYRSPRDLEVVAQVTGGIIALKKVVYDGGDGAASYYYCVTQEGEYGYVLESTGTLVPLAEAGFTAAQPLHGIAQTPVYNFPYKVSGSLCTLSTDENGSVVMTRGEESAHVLLTAEGTLQAGGVTWCKVLISEGENLLTGYMDARFVCPYVSYSPANVHDYCKIDSGRAGVYIKLYSQPGEEAEVVAELPDNTELLLAAPYDEESVWTCVFYGDSYAYVLTENITVSALTTVQITLIVVLCALVVPGVALCAVIYIKRKKKREYDEEN